MFNEATVKQRAFIERLLADKEVPKDNAESLKIKMAEGGLDKSDASKAIDWLLKQPASAKRPPREINVGVGVYKKDGVVFIVKPNRAKTNLYAKRLVEINGDRATESGDIVQIEFEYDQGAIYSLEPAHKMDLEEAKKLTIRYGKCIVCGRRLKDAKSVARGIGPVCRTYLEPAIEVATDPVQTILAGIGQ